MKKITIISAGNVGAHIASAIIHKTCRYNFIYWIWNNFMKMPNGRVFGSGTRLDTARLRWQRSEKLAIPVDQISGWILGEHGDSEFVAWSSVSHADRLDKQAQAQILESILYDKKNILPVSTPLHGEYSIKDIALGVPCIISVGGIEKTVEIPLSDIK